MHQYSFPNHSIFDFCLKVKHSETNLPHLNYF
nr:MAG TPA: hypothetical protein [Caudoviricetes sp.]